MRLFGWYLFLTLVLSASAASSAPVIDKSLPPIETSPKDFVAEIPSNRIETHNWSLRTGFFGGSISETNKAEQFYFYGLRYTDHYETLRAWDFEITTARNNFLHFVVSKRFYFPLETVTMPYYRIGAGNLVDSSENLVSIFNFKKVQALAYVGLDDLFSLNSHLQGEVGIGYAIIGPQFEMSLGFAF